MAEYFVGLDLGQASDYTAVAVAGLDAAHVAAARNRDAAYDRLEAAYNSPYYDRVDLREVERELEGQILGTVPEPVFEIRYLERLPLRTPYTEVARHLRGLMQTPPLQDNAELVVDSTGVGAAVVDILRDQGLSFKAVVITGGERESKDGSVYRVPKRDLISAAQVLLQNRRLRISAVLPEAKTLTEELMDYRLKQNIATGHVGFAPWREGQHDDLLLALCLAVWAADRRSLPVDETLVSTSGPFSLSEKDPYTFDDDAFLR